MLQVELVGDILRLRRRVMLDGRMLLAVRTLRSINGEFKKRWQGGPASPMAVCQTCKWYAPVYRPLDSPMWNRLFVASDLMPIGRLCSRKRCTKIRNSLNTPCRHQRYCANFTNGEYCYSLRKVADPETTCSPSCRNPLAS